MEIIPAIVLGVVQGITEFVPISSSGHLILVRDVWGLTTNNGLAFDAVLQLATSLAILLYFWNDFYSAAISILQRQTSTLGWALVVGTVPAAILGLFLEDVMETFFRNPGIVAGTLVAGAVLMAGAERFGLRNETLSLRRGWWVGVFQASALIPGMSRSGATISGGLFLGLSREEATRFSFMLGMPILLGSGAKKLIDLGAGGVLFDIGIPLLFGSITAFFVGLLVIHFLLKYLRSHTLYPFVIYRISIAILVLLLMT